MNNKVKILSVALFLVAIAGAGTWWFSVHKSTPKNAVVAIREIQTTAPTHWEIVKKLTGRDILAEEGVTLEPVTSIANNGGSVSLQTLLANNIDVNLAASWTSWINVIAHGGKVKALLGTAASTKTTESGTSGLLVLEDSPIKTIKDLAGKRIAVNVLGAEADYVIRQYLKKNGLSISQVELVAIPAEQEEQMLRSRQVDALAFATSGGPYFELTVEKGGVRQIPGTTNFEARGEGMMNAIGFRNEFIEKHPDAVRRYIRAYDIARRIIYDQYQKNPDIVRKAYADISVEKGSNPKLAKYFRASRWTPDFPFIVDKDIQWWIDRMTEDKLLKPGQIKPADVYTNEFNPLYKKK